MSCISIRSCPYSGVNLNVFIQDWEKSWMIKKRVIASELWKDHSTFGGDVGVWFFSNSFSKFYIKISWPERSKNQLFCTTVLNKSFGKIWERKNDCWCTKINWILFRLKIKSGIQRKKHSSSHIQVKWSVLYNPLLQITYLLSLEQLSEHMET
jgi:hypothetical protein